MFWLYVLSVVAGLLSSTVAWASHRASANADAQQRTLQKALDGKLDVTRYERDRTADSAWKADTHDMLIDVLCAKNVDPRNQKCRSH